MLSYTDKQVSENLMRIPHDTMSNVSVGKTMLNAHLQLYALTRALYTEEELHEMLIEFELENPNEQNGQLAY